MSLGRNNESMSSVNGVVTIDAIDIHRPTLSIGNQPWAGGPPPLGLLRAPLSQRSCVFFSAAVEEIPGKRESPQSPLQKKVRGLAIPGWTRKGW